MVASLRRGAWIASADDVRYTDSVTAAQLSALASPRLAAGETVAGSVVLGADVSADLPPPRTHRGVLTLSYAPVPGATEAEESVATVTLRCAEPTYRAAEFLVTEETTGRPVQMAMLRVRSLRLGRLRYWLDGFARDGRTRFLLPPDSLIVELQAQAHRPRLDTLAFPSGVTSLSLRRLVPELIDLQLNGATSPTSLAVTWFTARGTERAAPEPYLNDIGEGGISCPTRLRAQPTSRTELDARTVRYTYPLRACSAYAVLPIVSQAGDSTRFTCALRSGFAGCFEEQLVFAELAERQRHPAGRPAAASLGRRTPPS